jgi:hypothetical protein
MSTGRRAAIKKGLIDWLQAYPVVRFSRARQEASPN